MVDITTQRPITHLLLIDKEDETQIRKLVDNCLSFSKRLSEFFFTETNEAISHIYRIVLTVPESDKNLIYMATNIEAEMKSKGLNLSAHRVRDEDMFLAKGKVGLLSCSLWRVVGALLLNDVPIPVEVKTVWHILHLSNRLIYSGEQLVLRKKGWFGVDYHIGLLADGNSVGYLLKGLLSQFPPNHSLSDILKFMKFNCRKGELLITRF